MNKNLDISYLNFFEFKLKNSTSGNHHFVGFGSGWRARVQGGVLGNRGVEQWVDFGEIIVVEFSKGRGRGGIKDGDYRLV